MDGGKAEEEARCAVHPDEPADAACKRCGNYACEECECWPEDDVMVCDECFGRIWGRRKELRKSEQVIQAASSGSFLLGVVCAVGAGWFWYTVIRTNEWTYAPYAAWGTLAAAFAFWAGRELGRNHPRGLLVGCISSLLIVPSFPIGTLAGVINIATLLIHRRVLSEEHRALLAEQRALTGREVRPARPAGMMNPFSPK